MAHITYELLITQIQRAKGYLHKRTEFRIIKITSNRVLRIVEEGITLRNKGRDKSLIISQFKKESGKYLTKKFWYWTQFFFLFFRNMLDKKLWPKPFILHYTDRSLDLLYCTDKKRNELCIQCMTSFDSNCKYCIYRNITGSRD